MTPLSLTVAGQAFTIEQNDSYGVLSGKALIQAQNWGDQLTTMLGQLSQDASNLNTITSMSTWQISDWDATSTAGEQTILDRQASLKALGLVGDSNTAFVSTVSGAGPGNVQMPLSNSGANVELVDFDYFPVTDGGPFLANDHSTTLPVAPRQDTIYHNSGDHNYYIVDGNNKVWQVGGQTTLKPFYKPTAADLTKWQGQFQSLSTRWAGQSTTDNAIMQDLTNSYETALIVFTNTQQARAQVLTNQAKNIG
jgi:hypothetical protein